MGTLLINAPLNVLDIQWAPQFQQGLAVLVVLYLPLFLEDPLGHLDLGHPVKKDNITQRIITASTMAYVHASVNAH